MLFNKTKHVVGQCCGRTNAMGPVTWCKANNAFHHKNVIPAVKHGGGSVMVWGCFASAGTGRLVIIDETKNFALNQKILIRLACQFVI